MNRDSIHVAKVEALRFLHRVDALERYFVVNHVNMPNPIWFGTMETAALRRASMDLTRALAKMRSRRPSDDTDHYKTALQSRCRVQSKV
jgi:hypothetical protein